MNEYYNMFRYFCEVYKNILNMFYVNVQHFVMCVSVKSILYVLSLSRLRGDVGVYDL